MNNIEETIKSTLLNLDVKYEWIQVDPEFADTQAFTDKYGYRLDQSGNTIIVGSKRGEKKFSACIVLGIHKLDVNKKVKSLMATSRVSFATPEDTMLITGMLIGGVTPFGIPESIPFYIDAKVMESEFLIVGGGSRSGKIKIHPKELLKIPNAQIIEGLSL
jgi:prolyl-tRNA editing enzyme YbaK/EbsC (Cys-tRNA(Pro) deacylase)